MRIRTDRLLLLAALAAAACAPARPPAAEVVPAVVRLDEAGIAGVAALLRMEDARALDTTLVARLLADPVPEIRARASLGAGRIRDHAAAPLVLRALEDPDQAVRARAAFALGVLGDTTAPVITALSTAAADYAAYPSAAREAVFALGLLARPGGRPAIEAVLASAAAPATLRQEALLAIWRLPRDPGTIAAIAPLTASPDPETRWRAAYAAWRAGGTASVPLLLEMAGDADERVRANVMRGLRAPLADSAGVRDAALAVVLTAAADPHPHVRINALRLLPAYRDARGAPVLVAALADADANVAVTAAEALGQWPDANASSALAAAARADARPDAVRAAALAALMRSAPETGAAVARDWAASDRWLLRMHAATTLGGAASIAHAALLETLARDPSQLVAARALASLGTATDTLPALRRIYLEQLASPHILVRAAAASGLGRQPSSADLDPLLLAYERARADATPEAATAAVNALGRLIREGVPADRAFFARFGPGGAPRHAAVHRAIAQNIGAVPPAWGAAPPTVPAPRPMAFYADVVRRLVAPVLAGEPAPQVAIQTLHGDVVLELAAADAPLSVHSFLTLVEAGYYAGTRWHRVVPNFVLQDGDPRGDGSGGPGYTIRDEFNLLRYDRGMLGMALSGPDTGGGQFFITHSPQPHLDGGYTIFGRVVEGMDAADRVSQDEPIHGFRRTR